MFQIHRKRVAGYNSIDKTVYMTRFQDALDACQAITGMSDGCHWVQSNFEDNNYALWRDYNATQDTLEIKPVERVTDIKRAFAILTTSR
jgi:hypothetical protein